MNLVAIALLCQVTGVAQGHRQRDPTYDEIQTTQQSCQKYYVKCWNNKREEQLKNAAKGGKLTQDQIYDSDAFLAQCVLERP
jgi:hypothetical protein